MIIEKKIFSLAKRTDKLFFVVLFLFILIPLNANPQPGRRIERWFGEAKQHFSIQSYDLAIDYCKRILERYPDFVDAQLLLADIYYEMKIPEKEVIHLKKAGEITENPLIFLRLGNATFSQGKYNQALGFYEDYFNAARLDTDRKKELERKMESCRFAINSLEKPVDFSPERLSDSINSSYDDYWPSLSIDQQQLVFTRLIKDAGQRPQEDFYYSEFGPDGWGRAQPLTEINTADNEGAQCLSADGSILFFTACNRSGGMGSCDIYYSINRNGRWSVPVAADRPLNTPYWEAQPSLSSDDKYLYFSSNRPGGKGGKDIWRAECLGFGQNGRLAWKEPVNLGDSINTPGDETSPFVHAGNKNFYFASNYHIGMGGFDLFMSCISNDSVFSCPENLGYPINTVRDEKGLHISAGGLTAFFSSSRDNIDNIDIYSFRLDESIRPHPATYVHVKVCDEETGEPVQAIIDLSNLTNIIGQQTKKVTDKYGSALLCLPVGNNYAFSVSKEGYLFYSEAFDLSDAKQFYDPYDLDIELTPVKAGAEMNLYNIYFETDSFAILPESRPELLKLVGFLETNSLLKIEIQGHTDDTGSAEHNLELSKLRARSVVNFLIASGIEKSRLQWTGFGESKPVADNKTKEGRRLNRRTTIKILEK